MLGAPAMKYNWRGMTVQGPSHFPLSYVAKGVFYSMHTSHTLMLHVMQSSQAYLIHSVALCEAGLPKTTPRPIGHIRSSDELKCQGDAIHCGISTKVLSCCL